MEGEQKSYVMRDPSVVGGEPRKGYKVTRFTSCAGRLRCYWYNCNYWSFKHRPPECRST